MDASTLEVCEREHLIEEHIPRPQSVLRMDLSHYWISRVVALGAGFTCALLLAQALGPKVARGKTEGGGGQFLQEWKFEEVNVNSGDKVFDVLFNQTLYDCIEPVKHIADKRGRCYDTIFARQHKCYALRKEEPPASCKRTVKCLQGKKDEKPINPCEWLCTGGNRNQAWVKERCDKAAHDAMRWSGKCLDHGYEQRSFEAMEDVNVLSQRCVDETTSTTTQVGSHFFCWALVVPWTNEVDLLLMQQKLKKGIFECDGHEIYSDREMHIGGINTVKVDTDLHCKMNKITLTIENTNIFRAVWRKVLDRMVWMDYEWTVKADLDSVFVPNRLLHYVQDPWIQNHAQEGNGLWLNNCWRGLHGPIEVLSRQAMQIYNNRWLQCEAVAEAKPQEDVYLQECMQTLGIWKSDMKHLLAEDHCDHHDFWKCEGNFVAYHPFKEEKKWMECRNNLGDD